MNRILKVGAFIIRPNRSGCCDLLLFTHPDFPDAPIQVPGGTVEPGESIEEALMREIEEESGLTGSTIERKLGVSEIQSIQNKGVLLVRHCFLLRAPGNVQDTWMHIVKGAGLDEGLRFEFRWSAIQQDFALTGDLGFFLSPEHMPELYDEVL